MSTTEWRRLIASLRKRFPTECRVVVRRRPVVKYAGLTAFNGYEYHITIASGQDESGQIDALLHEWAHVCAIEQAHKHGGSWGVLYAEIYSSLTGEENEV